MEYIFNSNENKVNEGAFENAQILLDEILKKKFNYHNKGAVAKMPVVDLSIPCSLAVRYIVLEYRTKVCSSMYNVSQMRTSWIHEILKLFILQQPLSCKTKIKPKQSMFHVKH